MQQQQDHNEAGGDPCPSTIHAHAAIADTLSQMQQQLQQQDHDEVGTVDAAEHLGLTPGTLCAMRSHRRGPVYRKAPNGRVTYRRADLDAWQARRLA